MSKQLSVGGKILIFSMLCFIAGMCTDRYIYSSTYGLHMFARGLVVQGGRMPDVDTVYVHDTVRSYIPDSNAMYWYLVTPLGVKHTLTVNKIYQIGDTTYAQGMVLKINSEPHKLK